MITPVGSEVFSVGLVVGVVLGAFLGYAVAAFFAWLSRPRVRHFGFVTRGPEWRGGTLHKLWFELEGKLAPGSCTLELTCHGRSRFAKWDETGQPETWTGEFWPQLVAAGATQVLQLGRVYCVPILFSRNEELTIFSGWWFGGEQGAGAVPAIGPQDEIKIALTGLGLSWNAAFAADLIASGPSVMNADSDAYQGVLREYVQGLEAAGAPRKRASLPDYSFGGRVAEARARVRHVGKRLTRRRGY